MHVHKVWNGERKRKRKRKRETVNAKEKRGTEKRERKIRTGNIVLTRGVFGPVSLTSHFQQLCKRLKFKVKNYRIL